MSILSDGEILTAMNDSPENRITIDPYSIDCLQPASYDVHLSSSFIQYTGRSKTGISTLIDPRKVEDAETVETLARFNSFYLLGSGCFVLSSTIERIKVPNNIVSRVDGKSSLARLGLVIHATAGFIDPGYKGNITLEIFNFNKSPIKLWVGMTIAQLSFEKMNKDSLRPYGHPELNSKYQDSKGTVGSKYAG